MTASAATSAAGKSPTKRIVISEPDEEQLVKGLEGRELDPVLILFLKRLLKSRKWMRKINIPSARNDLAAVLVFTSALKKSGLEIVSELHVFLAGKTIVDKWQIMGEEEQPASLPPETFTSIDLVRVREHDGCVQVQIVVPLTGGGRKTVVRTFDFTAGATSVRVVPSPSVWTATETQPTHELVEARG